MKSQVTGDWLFSQKHKPARFVLYTLPGCTEKTQNLSLCYIYREAAFINEKQQGILQQTCEENGLVIKDKELYLYLYKKYQTLLLNLYMNFLSWPLQALKSFCKTFLFIATSW